MRDRDCHKIAKEILPQLPEFASNGKRLIFIAPVGNVLRGFAFEGQAYSREEFYFVCFYMPVVSPSDHLNLSYGYRLKSGDGFSWRASRDDAPRSLLKAINNGPLTWLRDIRSEQDAIDAIFEQSRLGKNESDPNFQQDIVCLQIISGQFEKANALISKIIDEEEGSDSKWILRIVERMKGLRFKLREDPQSAVRQVGDWRDYTLRSLGLEKWQ